MSEAFAAARLPGLLMIRPGARARLRDGAAGEVFGWDEEAAERALAENRVRLDQLQYKLYADRRFALLVVLQAVDAGGKDGTIRHVMGAFNPQGSHVTSFKAPAGEELGHDFLWRIHRRVPARGEVGIFNRSHYEDVLVPRVERTLAESALRQRCEQINDFERMLDYNAVRVVKLFLHVSREEQKRRLLARLEKPHKHWKFDPDDLRKRRQWDEYRRAYEMILTRCSTLTAPWYAIPADHKWFRNLAVSQVLVQALEKLPLEFPRAAFDRAKIRLR